jgi:DNA-binding XRE family transcriptional regulator
MDKQGLNKLQIEASVHVAINRFSASVMQAAARLEDDLLAIASGKRPGTQKGEPFGAYMRKLRHNLGLTARDVERRSGVSNPYIYQIETGTKPIPSVRALASLADALGIEREEFMMEAIRRSAKEVGGE